MLTTFIFYLFATVLVLAAGTVITARNPVHAVLFLILAFFNAAGLFVLLGAEFIAMLLVIVYVGAVAVLFLFVVMMLDTSFADLRKGAMQYGPLGGLLAGVLLVELITLYKGLNIPAVAQPVATLENTKALGMVLYTDYMLPFQVSGAILFVAMIGAIVLTHRVRPDVRRQKISEQISATEKDILKIEHVASGAGVDHA